MLHDKRGALCATSVVGAADAAAGNTDSARWRRAPLREKDNMADKQ